MKRVIIYIDGSNLYFSVKKKFDCSIDVRKLCNKLADKDDLVKINYYIKGGTVDENRCNANANAE